MAAGYHRWHRMMPTRAALLAALLLSACAPARPAGTTAAGGAPLNVLLVTVDTFRADRLGHGLTPTLDRLAAAGLAFTDARSVAPLTLPAPVSIMTGLRPPLHGARLNGAAYGGAATLATRLKRAGYRTGAVVGAFVLDRRFGLESGFDDYDDDIARDPAAMDTRADVRARNQGFSNQGIHTPPCRLRAQVCRLLISSSSANEVTSITTAMAVAPA